jgi:hypothetical protein
VCAIHQIWGWVKIGGQKDANASQSYQYLLVKSLSLFDLLTVMMVRIAHSSTLLLDGLLTIAT